MAAHSTSVPLRSRVHEEGGDVVAIPYFPPPSLSPTDDSKSVSFAKENAMRYGGISIPRAAVGSGDRSKAPTPIPPIAFMRTVDVDIDTESAVGRSRWSARRSNAFDHIIGYRCRAEALFWWGLVVPLLWAYGTLYLFNFMGPKGDVEVPVTPDGHLKQEEKRSSWVAKQSARKSFSQTLGQMSAGTEPEHTPTTIVTITRQEYRKEERDWALRSLVAFLIFLGVVGTLVAVIFSLKHRAEDYGGMDGGRGQGTMGMMGD